MSHMFRVDFITHHANGTVETGKVIVLAESHDQARDIVCAQLKLPTSRTQAETTKVKPPCYQVESHQDSVHKKPSVRSQREPLAPTQRYQITVQATNVHGQSEQQVMRKVGEELQARGAQTKLRHNINMSIDCSAADNAPKGSPSTLEKIEMYGVQSGGRVSGGQVRGK